MCKIVGRTILVIGVITSLLVSCQTNTDLTSNRTGWSDYAKFAVKDFTPLGIITVNSTETLTHSPLNLSVEEKGSKITYNVLMTEARKLGADDIINVRVDEQHTAIRTLFDFFTGYTDTKTFIGNALAIKYKDSVVGLVHGTQAGDDSGVTKDKDSTK